MIKLRHFPVFIMLTLPVSSRLLFKDNTHCTKELTNVIQHLAGHFAEHSLVHIVLPGDGTECLPSSIMEEWFTKWQLVLIMPQTITNIKDILTSPPDAYIIFFSDFQSSYQYQLYFFMETQLGLLSASWNPEAKFLLVSTTNELTDQVTDHMVIDTFNFLWKRNIFKVALVVTESNGKTVTFSSAPFSKRFGTCKEITTLQQLQIINSMEFSKRRIAGYTFDTPKTFLGCPLIANTFHLPPYTIVSKHNSTGNQSVYAGTEVELVYLLSKNYNFSLNLFTSDNAALNGWYNKLPNGSEVGMIHDIMTYQIDLAFGGAIPFGKSPNNYTYYMMEQIFTFTFNSMNWFVPTPEPIPHWRIGAIIFDPLVWFYLAALSVVFAIIYFLMQKLMTKVRPKESVPFMLFRSGIGNPVISPPKLTHLRIMFIAWYLFSMHIAIMYNTRLFFFLTNSPISPRIKTTEDLYKSGLKTCTTNIYRDLYVNSTTSYMKKLLEQSIVCNNMEKAVNKFFQKKDFSILGKEDTIGFLVKSNGTDLYKLDKSFIKYPVVMFTTKGSLLIKLLKKIIFLVSESGIKKYWQNKHLYDVIIKYTHKKRQAFTNSVLTLDDFVWIFLTLLCGLVLAFNVFLVELYYHICHQ